MIPFQDIFHYFRALPKANATSTLLFSLSLPVLWISKYISITYKRNPIAFPMELLLVSVLHNAIMITEWTVQEWPVWDGVVGLTTTNSLCHWFVGWISAMNFFVLPCYCENKLYLLYLLFILLTFYLFPVKISYCENNPCSQKAMRTSHSKLLHE